MKKSFLLLPTILLLLGCNSNPNVYDVNYSEDGYTMKEQTEDKITVSFYYNINNQETNLNSGLYATGNSLALKVDQIKKGSKVTCPDINPIRNGYDFDGWHKDSVISSLFDFENTVLEKNTFLYAHWTRTVEEEFVEPEYIEPSKIDDSISSNIEISGVLNVEIISSSTKLPTASISRLIKDKNDVTKCLNYKIKSNTTLVATYNESTSVISYTATRLGVSQSGTISVSNNKANLVVNNSTYENKAVNYENKSAAITDHAIMLAGSSSMENWSTSSQDLKPLTTFNHGIGGTTAQQWRDSLNQRLVYPFSPKTVVYYVGVNNLINSGDSVETTSNALKEMFDDVHSHLPDTKIYWVLINALPGYPSKLSMINGVNEAVKEYEKQHSYLKTVDAGKELLKANGQPNSSFFLTDGLHMSKYGYVLWGGHLKNVLIEDMKNA